MLLLLLVLLLLLSLSSSLLLAAVRSLCNCFLVAGHFVDRVVELLIQQLKNNNDRERIKALFVVTHLVNSSENVIRSRIANLITALRSMLGEHNVKVQKTVIL
jgi:hypothetical protein